MSIIVFPSDQVKPMSVTFSDDELDMLTERMTKPTLIPSAIPTFPTEVVNVKTGAVSWSYYKYKKQLKNCMTK